MFSLQFAIFQLQTNLWVNINWILMKYKVVSQKSQFWNVFNMNNHNHIHNTRIKHKSLLSCDFGLLNLNSWVFKFINSTKQYKQVYLQKYPVTGINRILFLHYILSTTDHYSLFSEDDIKKINLLNCDKANRQPWSICINHGLIQQKLSNEKTDYVPLTKLKALCGHMAF